MKQKLRNTILIMASVGFLLAHFPVQSTILPSPGEVQTPAAAEITGIENGISPRSDIDEYLLH